MAHPDFDRSVNPISTRGTDYAHSHLITTGTPGFSDLPTALPLGRDADAAPTFMENIVEL